MEPQNKGSGIGMDSKFAIIGTAGHIDHGKTALVTRLTGKNTDRLKEEQERGISIDIDFAPLAYPDGVLIGMVDVPGHERFVRNMLAGAAGIDAALLVVDVNEGIKPQTREHVAILELLGVEQGIVALTKVDLADPEWIELAREVVMEELSDTVFGQAPLFATSTKTGQGIDELRQALHDLALSVRSRDLNGAFRLPVDKVFSIPGIGTVVSGTVWRGQVKQGDVLEVLPKRKPVRVRTVQSHGSTVSSAQAGQRTALNLTGIEKDDIRRGHVLAAEGTLTETTLIDARIRLLEEAPKPLVHRERVHLHLGTAEVLSRVLLLEGDQLAPGDSGLAQLILERPIVCEATDPFVLRSYSPVTTIGGGRVLTARAPRLLRRKRDLVLRMLGAKDSDSPLQRLAALARQGESFAVADAIREFGVTEEEAKQMLEDGVREGLLVELPSGWYSPQSIDALLDKLAQALAAAHQKRRFEPFVPRTLIQSALGKQFPARDYEWLLAAGQERGLWTITQTGIKATDWEVQLNDAESAMLVQMLHSLEEARTAGRTEDELCSGFATRAGIAKGLLKYAVLTEQVIPVAPDVFVLAAVFLSDLLKIARLQEQSGEFTVANVRDELGSGRKTAVTLLEYMDKQGFSKRVGDVRTLTPLATEWLSAHSNATRSLNA